MGGGGAAITEQVMGGGGVQQCERGEILYAKLGTRSDEAMKRCDEALNTSLLQFLCQR